MVSPSSSNSFPGFDQLYLLGEPGASRAFRADLALSTDEAFAVTRHELRWNEPVIANWMMGAKSPVDVIWTGYAAPLLVSERVVDLLGSLGALGWSTYEVKVLGKGGESISGYRGLAVHGRCGPVENSKSIEIPRRYPAGIFPVWKGLYFDPGTWDGSHLFMPAGRAGWIFAVDEVKQAFERAKVKNIALRRLSDVERSKVEMNVSTNP